jgi:hypothetical protein
MKQFTYRLEIDTNKFIETHQANALTEIHAILIDVLHKLYIPFQDEDFITLRTLQKNLKRTRLNDFSLYKCEQSIIKVIKLQYEPNQKKEDLTPKTEKNIA